MTSLKPNSASVSASSASSSESVPSSAVPGQPGQVPVSVSTKCINCSSDLSKKENQSGFYSLTCSSRIRSPLSPATVELIPIHHALSTIFSFQKSVSSKGQTTSTNDNVDPDADVEDNFENSSVKSLLFDDLNLTSSPPPVCFTCYLVLNDLYRTYTEFNQLRKTNSYLSNKLRRLQNSFKISSSSSNAFDKNSSNLVTPSLRRSGRNRNKDEIDQPDPDPVARNDSLSGDLDPHRIFHQHRNRHLHSALDTDNLQESEFSSATANVIFQDTSTVVVESPLQNEAQVEFVKVEAEEIFEEFQDNDDDDNDNEGNNESSMEVESGHTEIEFSVEDASGDVKYTMDGEGEEYSEYSSNNVNLERDPLAGTNPNQRQQLHHLSHERTDLIDDTRAGMLLTIPIPESSRTLSTTRMTSSSSSRISTTYHYADNVNVRSNTLPPSHRNSVPIQQNHNGLPLWAVNQDGLNGKISRVPETAIVKKRGRGRPRGSGKGNHTSSSSRIIRVRKGNNDETRVFCKAGCGKSFANKNGMRRHLNEQHKGVKPFSCPSCQKRFARRDHLNNHLCDK